MVLGCTISVVSAQHPRCRVWAVMSGLKLMALQSSIQKDTNQYGSNNQNHPHEVNIPKKQSLQKESVCVNSVGRVKNFEAEPSLVFQGVTHFVEAVN